MAEKPRDRSRILLLLLVPLLAIAGWINRDIFMPDGDGAKAASQFGEFGGELSELEALPSLALERPVAGADYAAYRDLFQFSQSPEAVARQEALEERKEREREAAQVKQAEMERRRQERANRPQRARKAPEPVPPTFSYEYVGFLGPITDHYAVLSKPGGRGEDKKEDLRVVRVGEKIDKDFVVKKIDLDTLVIGYTNPKFRSKTKTVQLKQPKKSGKSSRSPASRRGSGGRRRR